MKSNLVKTSLDIIFLNPHKLFKINKTVTISLFPEREAYLESVTAGNKKAYDLTMKQFEVGKIDFLDVLIVQNDWLAARFAELYRAMQRLSNRAELHLPLGGSLER